MAGGAWFTFGNGAIGAYQRELISLPVTILIVAALLTVVAGGRYLLARRYPEEGP